MYPAMWDTYDWARLQRSSAGYVGLAEWRMLHRGSTAFRLLVVDCSCCAALSLAWSLRLGLHRLCRYGPATSHTAVYHLHHPSHHGRCSFFFGRASADSHLVKRYLPAALRAKKISSGRLAGASCQVSMHSSRSFLSTYTHMWQWWLARHCLTLTYYG